MANKKKRFSRLALGTAQFGLTYGIANHHGQVSRTLAGDMLNFAGVNGINTLDTAIAYGESETCLGEAGVSAYRVVTKLPPLPKQCQNVMEWVLTQFSTSLKRLNLPSVYGLLLHSPMQLLESEGRHIYRALMKLKEDGFVEKVGISIYSPDELTALIPLYSFDLVQAPFNLIDQRLHVSGWLDRLKQNGIEIHTRSAFLQGLLLMQSSAIPSKFSPWSEIWKKWHKWLDDQPVSALQACLASPLSHQEIDLVVVGADGLAHLKEIIDAAASLDGVVPPVLTSNDEDLINPSRWSSL